MSGWPKIKCGNFVKRSTLKLLKRENNIYAITVLFLIIFLISSSISLTEFKLSKTKNFEVFTTKDTLAFNICFGSSVRSNLGMSKTKKTLKINQADIKNH